MDIITIAKRGKMTRSEFRQLPDYIAALTKSQRAAFSLSFAKAIFGDHVSQSNVNMALESLVEFVMAHEPTDEDLDLVAPAMIESSWRCRSV
jgi:hypothetical protein